MFNQPKDKTMQETWWGYTEEEYNQLIKQPTDPLWQDLAKDPQDPDEDAE